MNYLDLVQVFRDLAKKHKDIKHSVGGRVSFFRLNKDGEITEGNNTRKDYPLLGLMNISGNFTKSGVVDDRVMLEFDIRKAVSNLGDWGEIDSVRAECKRIGDQIIARIEEICDEQGNCGPIEDFEVSDAQWEFIDATNLGEHGCRYRFYFVVSAYNQYTQDLDQIFINEFFIPLLDYDGTPLIDWDGETLMDLE